MQVLEWTRSLEGLNGVMAFSLRLKVKNFDQFTADG